MKKPTNDTHKYFLEEYKLPTIKMFERTLFPMIEGTRFFNLRTVPDAPARTEIVLKDIDFHQPSRATYYSRTSYRFYDLKTSRSCLLREWEVCPVDHEHEYLPGEVVLLYNDFSLKRNSGVKTGYPRLERVEILERLNPVHERDPLSTLYKIRRLGRKRVHTVLAYNLTKLPFMSYSKFYKFGDAPSESLILPYQNIPNICS